MNEEKAHVEAELKTMQWILANTFVNYTYYTIIGYLHVVCMHYVVLWCSVISCVYGQDDKLNVSKICPKCVY